MASKQTAAKKVQPEVEQKAFEQEPVGQTQIESEVPKRTGTKMEKATAIYLELANDGDHKRADFIKRFMSECDLSKERGRMANVGDTCSHSQAIPRYRYRSSPSLKR